MSQVLDFFRKFYTDYAIKLQKLISLLHAFKHLFPGCCLTEETALKKLIYRHKNSHIYIIFNKLLSHFPQINLIKSNLKMK